MFLLLLLLSQAGCEWVEISQNHYRKESQIHKVINFEHTTKTNTIYRNNSVTEKQWHRGSVDKVSHVANIRRVQHPSVKTYSLNTRHEDNRHDNNFYDHTHTVEAEYNFITIKPNIQKFHENNEEENILDNQTKVTVIQTTTDSIRDVQHSNSKPIKKLSNAVASIDRRTHYDEKQNEELNNVFNANHRKQVQINEPLVENDKLDFNENDKFYTIEKPNFNRVSFDDEVNLDVPNYSENRHSNYSISKEPNAPKIKLIQREENDYVKENDIYKQAISIDDKMKYKPDDTKLYPLEGYFDSRNNFKNPTGVIDKNTKEIVNVPNPQKPDQNKNMEITPSMDDKETFPNAQDFRFKDMLNVDKGNPVKGIWKMIKVVADTIYKNTHRSFKSKIKYLEGLKTTIMTSIEDQIDSAWPDDARGTPRPPTRQSRAAQARGHVEFPSSESTLMTISFLTFAVFLIKLVLQVIHTYKNKTMMVTPAVVAAVGRAAAAFRTSS